MSSFTVLKKRCWTTERTLTTRLEQLRNDAEAGRQVAQLEHDTHDLLSQDIEALAQAAAKEEGGSALFRTSYVQRQREALQEARGKFTAMQTARRHRERDELLEDTPRQARHYANATDYWLDERAQLDRSNQATDSLIQRAADFQLELEDQRQSISRSTGTVRTLINTVPGLNTLMGRIATRRRRDMYIMVAVISLCSILLLLYMMHR
ncbi:hypothetical protein THASP1DRAFT_29323 [Thamnocephalis sphaerospora]|uniref:Golgi SNAP receptor complex member 1 n=1 Tax=Thamnocephalis sphaerospora TaxID=78915 RepID=A0A4P9XS05_9FUNG|nr:hypothetical protein THASP1DRAFT_29323 [Thamnocephalis sphaerospora]|eukprot:RKP08886.1 hypothetical protein THASP1DRAFT_29323 [Thamnocephalis sphaerospora]